MNKFVIFLLVLCGTAFLVNAQSPAPDPDTLENPVKHIDPEVKQYPANIHYVDEMVRINADELPAAVQDTLQKLEPTGWKKSVVYRHKTNNSYVVEIRESGSEKIYQFTSEGKRVTQQRRKD